ncbi:amidohydrolase family protein, partial [Mycobacterium tuberculosis]
RGVPFARVVEWMSARPAAVAGLRRKGSIALGFDADLAVVEPDTAFVVDPKALHHKNPITPYADRALSGAVVATYLRGEEITLDRPTGRLLSRGDA